MQTEIQHRFDMIERQRAALTDDATALSIAQLCWKPSAGAWSVRQIIEHLVLSDETVGCARHSAAARQEPMPLRIVPRAWRMEMVLNAFRQNRVLPLPSPDVEPQGAAMLPELLSRWQTARMSMRDALETMRGGEAPYFHPILGRLTALQMLTLSEEHMDYHARQRDRLKADPAFPRRSWGNTP